MKMIPKTSLVASSVVPASAAESLTLLRQQHNAERDIERLLRKAGIGRNTIEAVMKRVDIVKQTARVMGPYRNRKIVLKRVSRPDEQEA